MAHLCSPFFPIFSTPTPPGTSGEAGSQELPQRVRPEPEGELVLIVTRDLGRWAERLLIPAEEVRGALHPSGAALRQGGGHRSTIDIGGAGNAVTFGELGEYPWIGEVPAFLEEGIS